MLQYTFVGHSMDFECWSNVEEDSNANDSIVPHKISSNSCPAGKISECSSIHFNNSVTSSIVSIIRVYETKRVHNTQCGKMKNLLSLKKYFVKPSV